MTIWKTCRRSSIAIVIAIMALLVAMPMASAHGKDNNVRVVNIHARVAGRTYGQWSKVWWQRAFMVPLLQPPLDSFGNCSVLNKPGAPIFFLAGTPANLSTATRTCPRVPPGKHIMFPIFNVEWSKVEAIRQLQATQGQTSCIVPGVNGKLIRGTNDAALLACATAQAKHALEPGASLEADVDGQMLKDLDDQEAASPPFNFTPASAGDPFMVCTPDVATTCPVAQRRAEADGFWIILKPLGKGTHKIHFAATVPFPDLIPPVTPPFIFTTDVTYTVVIK